MSKQHRIPNPFRFIYEHSHLLTPARYMLEDAEDFMDYLLVFIYLLTVLLLLYVTGLLLTPKAMLAVGTTCVIVIAIRYCLGHYRRPD